MQAAVRSRRAVVAAFQFVQHQHPQQSGAAAPHAPSS
eukprot:CAMPEP_0183423192 /NCGR_PEP_ID=MMETSP0370-20130417/28312_1 /TAXON_ID=268820 /ORGANISM="Peridinium aciculiferum, Strain PAER-2" /LENGTH=36 /DNA_ID= /DNA_START= /DNA_END= /DNA_ORIENTATION=